jgi:hypothetical protein
MRDQGLAKVTRPVAVEFLDTVAGLDPLWARSPTKREATLAQLRVRSVQPHPEGLSNRTINRSGNRIHPSPGIDGMQPDKLLILDAHHYPCGSLVSECVENSAGTPRIPDILASLPHPPVKTIPVPTPKHHPTIPTHPTFTGFLS